MQQCLASDSSRSLRVRCASWRRTSWYPWPSSWPCPPIGVSYTSYSEVPQTAWARRRCHTSKSGRNDKLRRVFTIWQSLWRGASDSTTYVLANAWRATNFYRQQTMPVELKLQHSLQEDRHHSQSRNVVRCMTKTLKSDNANSNEQCILDKCNDYFSFDENEDALR